MSLPLEKFLDSSIPYVAYGAARALVHPGKEADPCPYATLIMLKLLRLWKTSETEHPYMFYMGTDFRKLKLPFIWYDLLHVVEVLSRIPAVHADPAFTEMLAMVFSPELENGCFVPGSAYQEFKDWDFGQKKVPSEWLGLRVELIRARV